MQQQQQTHANLRSARLSAIHSEIEYHLREFSSPLRSDRSSNLAQISSLHQNLFSSGHRDARIPDVQRLSATESNQRRVRIQSSEGSEESDKSQMSSEINHSIKLAEDFSQFLFNESLADIKVKVRKSTGCFDSIRTSNLESIQFVEIPAHKIVLAARCPYFQNKLCQSWKDQNDGVALFEDFSENSMKEILRYIYTGKLKVDISYIMGVMKIASFLGLEQLFKACRSYLLNGKLLNAFDLCILYCEVRDEATDFDEMRSFLCGIIPSKIDSDILCRVLREIWVTPAEKPEVIVEVDQVQEPEEEEKKDQSDHIPDEKDLQDILIERLQMLIPEILEKESTKLDFFKLPRECIVSVITNHETLVSEILLYRTIEDRIIQLKNGNTDILQEEYVTKERIQSELEFAKRLLQYVRLPLMNNKHLVSDIKLSGFYDDNKIFEALQFKLAKEILDKREVDSFDRFQYRGIRIDMDRKHESIEVEKKGESMGCVVKRVSNVSEECYASAVMSKPLPLHGIHYWEMRIKNNNNQQIKQVFIGLCNMTDNLSFEDCHRSKSSVLLNCYDSSFWSNGQQLQVFSNRFIKIKQPLEHKDVIRLAVDLRHAHKFQYFWKENQLLSPENGGHNEEDVQLRSRNHMSIRERLRESIRYRPGRGANDSTGFNMFLNANNEIMLFNSPCKMHFAFNNSEFHEGVDLNLMHPKESPLNLVVSLLEQGVEVELSKAVYFDEWDLVPKEPFLLK